MLAVDKLTEIVAGILDKSPGFDLNRSCNQCHREEGSDHRPWCSQARVRVVNRAVMELREKMG